MKNLKCMQIISLLVIGVSATLKTGASLIGISLPDIAVRMLGLCDLIAPSVLVFASIKKNQKAKQSE